MIYPGSGADYRRGTGLNGLILISLLAHLLILSLLVFSPSFLPAPKWTFGPVYSVQLVSMPASLPEKKGMDAASYGEIMNVGTSDRSVLKKDAYDTSAVVPLVPMEAKRRSSASLDTVLESIRKNVQSSAATSAPDTAPKTSNVSGAPAVTPSGGRGDAELNAKMKNYYALIWSRIKGLWTLPQGIAPQENIYAVIHAKVMRDGTVAGVGFERRSGNNYFDESALRTVKKASPFPPLPDGFRESSMEIGIRFHSSEFR